MNYLRKQLKRSAAIHSLYYTLARSWSILKLDTTLFNRIRLLSNFYKEFRKYAKQNTNPDLILSPYDIQPCLYDNTEITPIDFVYFYQDAWCAKKIFENKPEHHYDFGSKVEMVGIISQFTKTTMLDIRPVDVNLPGLLFKRADILKTGIADDSIESLSSICVLEHIGLGRYGDPVDTFGTEKAINEIKRILAPSGNLYVSLPVDRDNKIYFNAHRAFTRNYILKIFAPLKLVEEKYIYGKRMCDEYDASRGFGTGMFHFKKTWVRK